jgi:VWFA-related protein
MSKSSVKNGVGTMAATGLVLVAWLATPANQAQQPTFRSATDLLIVETQVVDRNGRPIPSLLPGAFEVTVGGKRRTVVSADLVDYAAGFSGEAGFGTVLPSGVPPPREGRLYVIAVDENSFTDRSLPPMLEEAKRFLAKLQPQDHVAVYGFPTSKTFVTPTRDRQAVRAALGPALGVRVPPESRYKLSPSEIIDLTVPDRETLADVVERECPTDRSVCPQAVMQEAKFLASYAEAQARQSMGGLRALFSALAPVPGRKTVILLSGGMLSSDRMGGRPDISTPSKDAGRQAAEANATLYILHADTHFDDLLNLRRGHGARGPQIRDTSQMAEGLDYVAGTANGHLINVKAGSAAPAFDRIVSETAAYYILGVATDPKDRDGKVHFISVKVKEPSGATVRHRLSMVVK